MRVLVTGGAGFVGSHSVAALAKAGHDVRLLVRRPERLERALRPLGIAGVDARTGDVTDADAVERAIEGCDAVVHAAAVFTLDRRRDAEVMRVNVRGSELVLGAAVRAKLDPIVHVSSVSALFPPRGDVLTPDESVKYPQDTYARSKAAAERIARGHQAAGAPVVTVYPGSVWGPNDPTLGDGIALIMRFVRAGFIPVSPGGIPVVDVRDVAAVVASAMAPGRGPKRYMVSGSFLGNAALTDILNDITGRKIRKLPLSGGLIRGIGRLGDFARRTLGVDLGLTYEATYTLTHGVPCDDSRITEDLGVRCRPATTTLSDTLRWMYQQGLLKRRHVGDLAA